MSASSNEHPAEAISDLWEAFGEYTADDLDRLASQAADGGVIATTEPDPDNGLYGVTVDSTVVIDGLTFSQALDLEGLIRDRRARTRKIEGLRQLADFLEAHPELPVTMGYATYLGHALGASADKQRQLLDTIRQVPGWAVKQRSGGRELVVSWKFGGGIVYDVTLSTDAVAEPVIVTDDRTGRRRVDWRMPDDVVETGRSS